MLYSAGEYSHIFASLGACSCISTRRKLVPNNEIHPMAMSPQQKYLKTCSYTFITTTPKGSGYGQLRLQMHDYNGMHSQYQFRQTLETNTILMLLPY